ncbi:MAG: histidine phosphatase family protein [Acutalibacteraceae bacterium]|jgi:broad specificity phosphatase PhoE
MLLYLIRHGDPVYSPDKLTALGKRQAEAIGRRLALADIDEIYSSSSNRAIQTATPLADITGKEIDILDWSNENYVWREFTVFENDQRKWIFESEQMRIIMNSDRVISMGFEWYKHNAFSETNVANGMERIGENADLFLESLGYRHDLENRQYIAENPNDKRIAFFAHDGFSRAFLSYILDIPYPVFIKFSYIHTGMTVIHFPDNDGVSLPTLLQYSGDGHLYKEGLPTKYNNEIFV